MASYHPTHPQTTTNHPIPEQDNKTTTEYPTSPQKAHLTPSTSPNSLKPDDLLQSLPLPVTTPNGKPPKSWQETYDLYIAQNAKYERGKGTGLGMTKVANIKTEWKYGSRARVVKYMAGFVVLAVVLLFVVALVIAVIVHYATNRKEKGDFGQ